MAMTARVAGKTATAERADEQKGQRRAQHHLDDLGAEREQDRIAQRRLEDRVLPGPGEIVESDELRVGAAHGLIGECDPDRQCKRIPDQRDDIDDRG